MSVLPHFQPAVAGWPRQSVICSSSDIGAGGDSSRSQGNVSKTSRCSFKTLPRQSEHKNQHQRKERAFGYNPSPQRTAVRSQGAFQKVSLSGRRRARSSGCFSQGTRRLQRLARSCGNSIGLPASSHCRVPFACAGISSFGLSPETQPNPSVKPSPNGGPPGPGHRYGVHFMWPGPGVPPLVPSYLER